MSSTETGLGTAWGLLLQGDLYSKCPKSAVVFRNHAGQADGVVVGGAGAGARDGRAAPFLPTAGAGPARSVLAASQLALARPRVQPARDAGPAHRRPGRAGAALAQQQPAVLAAGSAREEPQAARRGPQVDTSAAPPERNGSA